MLHHVNSTTYLFIVHSSWFALGTFRYIEENYSKIRDVERELTGLTMEMKLTAGPKKAGWCIICFLFLTLAMVLHFCHFVCLSITFFSFTSWHLVALEHMRKKIEMSTEKIRLAKLKEEEAKKVWVFLLIYVHLLSFSFTKLIIANIYIYMLQALEAASKAVKDEEALKQKLCEDLNNLVLYITLFFCFQCIV